MQFAWLFYNLQITQKRKFLVVYSSKKKTYSPNNSRTFLHHVMKESVRLEHTFVLGHICVQCAHTLTVAVKSTLKPKYSNYNLLFVACNQIHVISRPHPVIRYVQMTSGHARVHQHIQPSTRTTIKIQFCTVNNVSTA